MNSSMSLRQGCVFVWVKVIGRGGASCCMLGLVIIHLTGIFSFQQLYQILTDYDIRYYMYELLKVSDGASPAPLVCDLMGVYEGLDVSERCVCFFRLWITATARGSCTATSSLITS